MSDLLLLLRDPHRVGACRLALSAGPPRWRRLLRAGLAVPALAAVPAALLLPATAHAQDRPIEQPGSLIEALRPVGFRLGKLKLFPSLRADTQYDSNIRNRQTAPVEDVVMVSRPVVRVETDWARHSAALNLGGELRRYRDHSSENSLQYYAATAARLDFADRVTVAPAAMIARRIEPRGTFGDQLTDEPIRYMEKRLGLRVARDGGRLELAASPSLSTLSYRDSRVGDLRIDQSHRDLRRATLNLRADVRVSWRLGAFLSATATDIAYRQRAPLRRGSRGASLLGGATVRITDLVQAEAAVGYARHQFHDPLAKDFSGLDFSLKGRWNPRPRLQLAVEGGRSVERSPVAEAAGVLETRLTAAAQYALGDRWRLGVETGYVTEDFRGIARRDRRLVGGVSVDYRLAPTVSAFAAAGYRRQDSDSAAGRRYRGSTFRVGLRFVP